MQTLRDRWEQTPPAQKLLLGIGVIGIFYGFSLFSRKENGTSDPKSSLLTMFSTVPKLRNPPLNLNQTQMARLIVHRFRAAGLPDSVTAAAIVNAWAESSLNPNAVSPAGTAVGLFQLHDNGAGHGMSIATRKDPAANTNKIIQEIKGHFGRTLLEQASRGASVWELTKLFTVHIERPGDANRRGDERAALAESWWGPVCKETGTVRLPEAWE
jgi:hypothetical protein